MMSAVGLAGEAQGPAVAISPDSGLKYAGFFVDILGDEGKPTM